MIPSSIEIDVDAVADGERVVIGGIMEHVEEAGVHSGDSGCSLPAYTLPAQILDQIREYTTRIGRALEGKFLEDHGFEFSAFVRHR